MEAGVSWIMIAEQGGVMGEDVSWKVLFLEV